MKINQQITRQDTVELYKCRVAELREYFGEDVAKKFYAEVKTQTKGVSSYAEIVVIIGDVFFQLTNEEC